MSLVISRSVLSTQLDGLDNRPIIGWHNLVTVGGVAADTSHSNFPATNLANPQTFSRWQADSTAEQYVTFSTGTADDIDYLAIARHNLATAAIPISIEGDSGDGIWFELVQDVQLVSDDPVIFRFVPQSLTRIRIRLQMGTVAAQMAVVYFGTLLKLERRIWVGQTAPNDGIEVTMTNGRSEGGEYLGTIETSRRSAIKVPLSLINPDWYRANLRPLLTAKPRVPFFFAWRPQDYPQEVGFMWLTAVPKPTNESPSGLIALALDLQGIA